MFTLGCDPEVFVKKNGTAVSAHGLIEGTKKEPFKTEGGAVQVDGLALEFNTDPVASHDFEGFNRNIIKQVKYLQKVTKEIDKDYTLSPTPTMDFSEKVMKEAPNEAKELGCDPDFNAYTLEPNPRPQGADVLFRTGAGHIHVGWGANIPVDNPEHMEICASFVKQMDNTVGLFMTYIDRDPRRRELYGKAGAFRPKSYGVEYRTPSNVWIRNKDFRKCVHTLTNIAIRNTTIEKLPFYYDRNTGNIVTFESTEEIINTGDFATAEKILDGLLIPREWTRVKEMMEATNA